MGVFYVGGQFGWQVQPEFLHSLRAAIEKEERTLSNRKMKVREMTEN